MTKEIGNSKTYAPEQVAFAERVSKAMANVPEEKRPMLETVVESVLIGASIALHPTVAQNSA